jgi:hypothetical protein
LTRNRLDPGIDSVPIRDHSLHDLAGQLGRQWVALDLREMPFEDGGRGPLAELGLEDRRECDPSSRSFRSDLV